MKLEHAKAAWVTPRLGRNGNLLYMGPLLKGISTIYKSFSVFTVEYEGDCNSAGIDITCMGSIKLVNQDETKDGVPFAIPLISPAIIKQLYRYKPNLLILNEFGMLTIYGILLSFVLPSTKILLIVENRPIQLGSSSGKVIRNILRRLIAKCAHAILTNNDDGKSYLIQNLGVRESRIICQPYLVSDMSQNNTEQSNLQRTDKTSRVNRPVHFIFVGRLIQLKGLQHALEAFHHLMEKHPEKFIFDIVGDGPYRSILEDQTKKLGLSEHVCFHGHQTYEGLTKTYQNADAFIFPTLMDYRSLVCFEAMSVGLPIIASIHDGGSIETVDEGNNGYTFDPLNYPKLAEILSRFIEHPEITKTFSARSKKMSENYTLPRAIESVALASSLALKSLNSRP